MQQHQSAKSAAPAWAPRPLPVRTLRPISARQLQLAADVELALGNLRRAELLAWAAHVARGEVAP